jgi:URI fold toxin 2
MPHGNSNDNFKPHHLYAIYDKEKEDIFKYGISHDLIDSNGLSDRVRKQLIFLNSAVDWERFYGKILVVNIDGKIKARVLEDEYINAYEIEFGQKPRGNM